MKAFLKKCGIYLLTVTVVCSLLASLLFFVIAPQYSMGYNAAILDKMERLRSLDGPKIILIGDSNLAYGMDSAVLEERLDMPVVNLGLHGGLGSAFHERMAYGEIGEGDIVVVCHTGYTKGAAAVGDAELAWITIENHFDLWPVIPPADRLSMWKTLPGYAVKCTGLFLSGKGNQSTQDSYRRSAFNEYGDVACDRPDGTYEMTGAQHTGVFGVDETGIAGINRLNALCGKAGAKLCVAAYPVMDDGQAPEPERFAAAVERLREGIDCPFISDFADYYYPPDLFYNTAYHMTSHGAHLRAEQLARDLRLAFLS